LQLSRVDAPAETLRQAPDEQRVAKVGVDDTAGGNEEQNLDARLKRSHGSTLRCREVEKEGFGPCRTRADLIKAGITQWNDAAFHNVLTFEQSWAVLSSGTEPVLNIKARRQPCDCLLREGFPVPHVPILPVPGI